MNPPENLSLFAQIDSQNIPEGYEKRGKKVKFILYFPVLLS